MTHLVNRLTFELECQDEEQAFELKEKFSSAAHEQIGSIIDNVCSKYVSENEWVRIDKLEIELGEFSFDLFEQEFSKAFIKQFESIIAQRITRAPGEKAESSRESYEIEILEYFLLKGSLPWWGDESSLDIDEISSSIFKNRKAEISDFFRNNYNNYALWDRASFQLKREVLYILIQLFKELSYAYDILKSILELMIGELRSKEEVMKAFFKGDTEQIREMAVNIIVSNAPYIFEAGNDIQKIRTILAGQAVKVIVSLNNDPGMKGTIVNILNNVNEGTLTLGINPKSGIVSSLTGIDAVTPGSGKSGIIDPAINTGTVKTDDIEKEKLVVRHAGIILAAPFLKSFYTKLGLLEDNSWVSRDAQFRGIFLLKYLSSGITRSFEYQLILEKLLCGIAPEVPVPSEIILNDREMEESDLLLSSVIEHWKALKNTSVNGLRETFLKRDGIIMKTESGWLLQVERKTVDVLLGSIPWGFSAIRLPWNEYLIITEW